MTETVPGLTYGDLDRLLRQAGFEVREKAEGRAYLHQETGAFIPLPRYDLAEPLRAHHLTAARSVSDLYGLIDRTDFDTKLHAEHSSHEATPAVN